MVARTWPSACAGTNLTSCLIDHRVDTYAIAGMVTSGCGRGTDRFSLNPRAIVPHECVPHGGQTSHQVASLEIPRKYGDVSPPEPVPAEVNAVAAEGTRGAPAHSPGEGPARPSPGRRGFRREI